MFWARCGRHPASLLRAECTSIRAAKYYSEIESRHIATISKSVVLDYDQSRRRNDTCTDNLDERIGECSKWVGDRSRADQMRTRSSVSIEEQNSAITASEQRSTVDHAGLERSEIDWINSEVSRLISIDQSSDAIRLFQDWSQRRFSARQEEHRDSMHDIEGGILYEETVRDLIRWCLKNDKEHTLEQSLFALQQEEVPQDCDTAKLLRQHMQGRRELILLLPENLQILLYSHQFQRDQDGKVRKSEFREKIGEDARKRLFIPIAIALIKLRDIRLANWLLKRCEELGVKQMPVGIGNVFAEAAAQHANASTGFKGRSAIGQIIYALRYLENCQDGNEEVVMQTHALIIRKLRTFMKSNDSFELLQAREWRGIFRRLTLIGLRNGALMIQSFQSNEGGLSALIPLHIKVEDYIYAKRLFELYQDHYGRYTNESPFKSAEFAWLFEMSLKAESSIEFTVKLFRHWLISDLSAPNRMPNFLPAQLRRYSSRLMEEKRSDEVLPLLSLFNLDSETSGINEQQKIVKKIEKRAQARRTIGVFANASPKYFLEFIPFLQEMLTFLRTRSKDEFDEHLIALHLHVVDKSKNSERYASSPELLRAQMFSIVEGMRQHAVRTFKEGKLASGKASTISPETTRALRLLYRRILKYLGDNLAIDKTLYRSQYEDRDAHLADELENLLDEMRSLWSMNLEEVDRDSVNSAITNCRLQIMMGRKNWQGAFELFSDFMKASAEQWERFMDIAETGKTKLTDSYPPLPFSLNVATRLALALGQDGQFDKARQVLSTHTHCTKHFVSARLGLGEEKKEKYDEDDPPKQKQNVTRQIKDYNRLLIESTRIALLCMQDRYQEALDRIYSLERLGVFGSPPQPQTPLMFYADGRQVGRNGLNFNSNMQTDLFPSASPSIGPTNIELTITFIEALASIPMKARSADWQGLLVRSQKRLSNYTGAKIFPIENRF